MKNIELDKKVEQIEGKNRVLSGFQLKFVAFIAFLWSLFQLWHASPLPFTLGFGVFIDLPARAIHLGFALFIAFLAFPLLKKNRDEKFNIFSIFISLLALFSTLYIFVDYEGLVNRNGILLVNSFNLFGNQIKIPTELIIGLIGIFLLLEGTRRSIGLPLVIVALVFLIYSYYGAQVFYLLKFY